MMLRNWVKFGLLGVAGCVLTTVLATSAHAVDPGAEELIKRLERLEQQNIELKQKLDNIEKESNVVLDEEGADPTAGADKKAVQKIVADYLKATEKQKKADDEKKKLKDETEGVEVGKDVTFKTTFKNGVHFETGDKAFKAALRGRWQNDWGWVNHADNFPIDNEKLDDGAIFRRARLGIQGTIWEQMDFIAEFDFVESASQVNFLQVWVGAHDLPYIQVFRVGHMKEPYSLEQQTSSNYLTFIERNINDDAFAESYNPGFIIARDFLDQRATLTTGLFRSSAGNNFGGVAAVGDGDYAWTTRATALPMYQHDGRCLVHVGGSLSLRTMDRVDTAEGTPNPPGNAPNPPYGSRQYRSRPYRVDPEEFLDVTMFGDDRVQLNTEFLTILGPFSIQAEAYYDKFRNGRFANNNLLGTTNLGDVEFYGWYAFASYYLTGENRTYLKTPNTSTGHAAPAIGRPMVYSPFFMLRRGACGDEGIARGWGAWEVAARMGYLKLIDGGFATATTQTGAVVAPAPIGAVSQSGRLWQYTLGLNWYLNPNMKVQWNYEHLVLDTLPAGSVGTLGTEDVDTFVMRFHWDF
jgi:phosphate-selective porin OprO/OprP